MFDLRPDDTQRDIVSMLHRLAEQKLRPAARSAEADRATPPGLARELHATGLTAPLPEDLGGQGMPDPVTYLMAAEELAWGDPGIAASALTAGHAGILVASAATPSAQARLLPSLLDGRPGSVALYEGYGRRLSELETTAEAVADAGWRIRGTKLAVAHHDTASVFVVVARDAAGELAAFAVDPATAGITVRRSDVTEGALALTPVRYAALDLDVTVDADARLAGDPADLARAITLVRLGYAAIALGCARAALEYAADYAGQRIAFGRPIAAFQGISFLIADGHAELDAARLGLWEAATTPTGADAQERADRAIAVCAESTLSVTRTGLQVLGGHGFTTDHPVERWYRAAAVLAALDFDPLACPVGIL